MNPILLATPYRMELLELEEPPEPLEEPPPEAPELFVLAELPEAPVLLEPFDVVAAPAFSDDVPLCRMYDGICTVFRFVVYTFFRDIEICLA